MTLLFKRTSTNRYHLESDVDGLDCLNFFGEGGESGHCFYIRRFLYFFRSI